jgi:hypothetical protein
MISHTVTKKVVGVFVPRFFVRRFNVVVKQSVLLLKVGALLD